MARGDSPQHVVADGVTERVVDVLQRIDIGEDHGDPATIPSGMSERDADAVVEKRPPGQTGEVVVGERLLRSRGG